MSSGIDPIESARARIGQLVERFRANEAAYKNSAYNETQTRREFIDPFFKALGWDVDNEAGYAEAYKDVIHEDAIKATVGTLAPDYCFRVGGQRKFFVEAKKPSVDMKNDPTPYYQLRRYGYSAKLPLSIVTDFEEFAVVDCRAKPGLGDKASTGRIRYWRYDEYLDHLDELLGTFSPEGIKKGGLDKLVTSAKAKRGTGEVDKEFLKEIESWRELLARSIALRNPGLTQRELNTAVQLTIDRIIFLRICEDRGIEEYGLLQGMQNGANVYARMCEMFQRADERYNSGLFHFKEERGNPNHPDSMTLGLAIDDKPLKQILKGLYYPDSPYEFSVLPADILGQVYEQFLGKVIRLTTGHRAVIEDKPEVKKAGGVYYTPTYIVDYIVKNTVGKLLEGKTPKQAEKLRILDPACGSGSFLIGAYEYLMDWHRDWYSANDPEKWAKGKEPRLFSGKQGWQLTTVEKKRILLNNIYGVDIDAQAVEVTKLSLLLKVLEEESAETIGVNLKLFHERALPDLGNNIKCGNSLIGSDFYEGQQLGMLDEEEMYRINPFDWEDEFSEIMKGGGFDAVIGNPPYVRMEGFKEIKGYLKLKYESHDERSDLYTYFVEKEHKILRRDGRFGMIVSNKFLRARYGKPLRRFLNTNASVEKIVDFAGLPIFPGATVRTIVLITRHGKDLQASPLYYPPLEMKSFGSVSTGVVSVEQAIEEDYYPLSGLSLNLSEWRFAKQEVINLLDKLQESNAPLSKHADSQIFRGIVSGLEGAFIVDQETRLELINTDSQLDTIIKPYLNGREVQRYHISSKGSYILYIHDSINIQKYEKILDYLQPFRKQLSQRAGKQKWYELQQPQLNYYHYFESPKIIFPDIATSPRFAIDSVGYFGASTTFFIPSNDLFLLGLLNSKLGFFYFSQTCAALEGKAESYLRFKKQYVEGFPIRAIDFADPSDKSRHDQMVELVDRMLDLNKRLESAKTAYDKTTLQRQIDATDRQIDRLVYELYDLTDKEIQIVEGRSRD